MIYDSIENHSLYPFGPLWEKAFEFIGTLTAKSDEGKYILDGDNLFVGIDSYTTKMRDNAKPETHRKYVDIQILLSGRETIEVDAKSKLIISEPYDVERDLEFYQRPDAAPASVELKSGAFAVFFPDDAHTPGLAINNTPTRVKKAVVKIAVDQLS